MLSILERRSILCVGRIPNVEETTTLSAPLGYANGQQQFTHSCRESSTSSNKVFVTSQSITDVTSLFTGVFAVEAHKSLVTVKPLDGKPLNWFLAYKSCY